VPSRRNELLEQYPDLAEELEEVARKMEAENKEYQAQADDLQRRVSQSKESNDIVGEGEVGAAFLSSKLQSPSGEANVTDDEAEGLVVTEEEFGHDINHDIPTSENDEADDTRISDESTPTSPSTDLKSPDSIASGNEDFTLSHLAVATLKALLKQSRDDMKRIFGVVMPFVKQLFSAGEKAWRTLKALFVQAREAYEFANQGASDQPESEDAAKSM
jgi:hypothetical protein